VRFVTLQTSGIPESADDPATREAISKGIEEATLLGRAATLEDVGNAAAFAASDWARTMTGAALNISCGAFVD
jgi:3-oxoacyl-[acyl-carrier protein] reductase